MSQTPAVQQKRPHVVVMGGGFGGLAAVRGLRKADVDITRQVVEAARTLRIAVHDHLVVGRDGVASFKALGLL